MATEFFISKMSDHMEEATFVEWLVAEGDAVEKGQPILVVDTDKVVAEMEAPSDGFLVGIRPGLEDGALIPIGVTVAFIVEDLAEEVPVLEPLSAATQEFPPTEDSDLGEAPASVELTANEVSNGSQSAGPVRATPAGRKAARELNVELGSVRGTGPGGRISESDVRKHVSTASVDETTPAGTGESDEFLELTPVQRVTARRMVESVTQVPQFSLVQHFDMTNVLRAREALVSGAAARPSVTAYLVKAIAMALVEHPRTNGFFQEGRIAINTDINVGVALGTDGGLYVPVIHNADRLSVAEISDDLRRLTGLADGPGFSAADLDGGTFTLSNLGMYGIDEFRAIVNPPQAAILATGRVSKVAVVDADGAIKVRDRMTATITADHRGLDGVGAAMFLSSVASFLGGSNRNPGGTT